jgi:hypothetical protein
VVWEPPKWDFPQDAKATVPKEIVSKLRVSNVVITLEDTRLDKVEQLLGGTAGAKGNAGDSMQWLCFHGTDGAGQWVLWLESKEIDAGYVGSFQWQRLSSDAKIDSPMSRSQRYDRNEARCASETRDGRSRCVKDSWQAFVAAGEKLIYLHEHEGSVNGVPFDLSNIVVVRVHGGEITSIAASKTKSS